MKVRITLTYRKITKERLDVAFLSKAMEDSPDFAPLMSFDKTMDEIRDQVQRVLKDRNIEDGPFVVTIEAGK